MQGEAYYPGKSRKRPVVKQISTGRFNVTGMVAETPDGLIVTREDMNHATEIYAYRFAQRDFKQLTHVNDDLRQAGFAHRREALCNHDRSQKNVGLGGIAPHFDPYKKYPTYCIAKGGASRPIAVLLLSLELPVDGLAGIYRGGPQSQGYAGSWRAVERGDQHGLGRAKHARLPFRHRCVR